MRLHAPLQHREVVGARLVEAVVAVPDDRLGRVARLERLVVLLLDRVEEAVAELEGLPVLPHLAPPDPRRELRRVHVLVDAGDLPVAAVGDDADPQRAPVTGVHHAVERVLDDEAVVEGVDDAVVVGAAALAGVAVGVARQVLVARRLAAEDVVPDDAVVGVEAVEHVDAAVLVRVEERFAQLADLVLVHENLPESRYSNSLTILPSWTSATRHADSAHRGAVVGDDVARVLHDEPVVEGVDDAVVVQAPPVEALARRRARRGCRRGSTPAPVTLNHIVISGA